MKAYTDLEQSQKLAEILPIESADFHFSANQSPQGYLEKPIWGNSEYADYSAFPCWSLAALLDVLPFPQLSKDKLGSGKVGWMVSVYPNDCRYDSCWHDNPIDTCVEMINKLKEKDLL